MVSPKRPANNPNWLSEELDRVRERMGEVIDNRYYVMEITPTYHQHSEYDDGDWIPEKHVIVSPYFKTKREATKWMDDHEPDKGKTLGIGHDKKYRRVVEEWH